MNSVGFANALAPYLTTTVAARPSRTADDLPTERAAKYKLNRFAAVRRAEVGFARQLRKIARHVGEVIGAFPPGDPAALPALEHSLDMYASVIEPWARATVAKIIAEISRRDEQAWAEIASQMRRALREEIRSAPTGAMLRQRLEEQVGLIRSLPIDAAQRVHELTIEGLSSGARFKEIVPMIMSSGHVAVERANVIARTETARTAAALTQVRAEYVGSTHYRWLSSRDGRTRKLHRKLDGTVHRWDSPPIAEESGERHAPGEFPNCRCVAIPLVPDRIV
jgi:SPP1 gp7 family putative phage head morphogenesis protein